MSRRAAERIAGPLPSGSPTVAGAMPFIIQRQRTNDGTSCGGARFPGMEREIDSPADELREDGGARTKRAAKETIDPAEKERLDRIAKENQAKAVDLENDFSWA
jgi:hypothetical protein